MRDGIWLRSLVFCEDVRFELGGTVTLVGVFGESIVVPPGDGEIVLPKLVVYCAIGGLREHEELAWRQVLYIDGAPDGAPLAGRKEAHDPRFDEHRLINVLSPVVVPKPARCRLAVEIETRRERRTIEYAFSVERAAA